MSWEDDPMTRALIGQAIKVHSRLGPGLPENRYHQEIKTDLREAGIRFQSKPRAPLFYRGIIADTFEPDFVIEEHFIPELKCVRGTFAAEHDVQVFGYSKFFGLPTSLLLDFGKQSLAWKRLIFTSKDATLREVTPPSFVTEPDLGRGVLRVVSECLQQIGLGYKESTWKGLVRASLQAAGYKVLTSPMVQVLEHPPKSLSSLVVKNTCALLTVALGNRIQAADRAVLQTHLRWLNLSWGVVLHFGKTSADECFVKSRDKGRSVLENQSCWETNVVLVNSQGYHQVMVESVQESRLGTVLGRHSCNGHISWGKSRSHDVSHPSARYVGG